MSRNRARILRCGRSVGPICALIGLAYGASTASAQFSDDGNAAIDPLPSTADTDARTVQGGPISLDDAVALARRRFEGRVVRAETRTVNGREVHVIRILDSSGRVRNVQIDAQTGRIR